MDDSRDWIIDENGFYVATRSFLSRRGYCCANQCCNCPYINWRNNPEWRPLPAKYVRRRCVSLKALTGARAMLAYHEQQGIPANQEEAALHQAMLAHYRFLLECWESTL